LTSIIIPNSVTSIGREAFYWCSNLTDIQIPERFKDEDTLEHLGFDDTQIDLILKNTK
jgi:hypothetical protein